VKPGETLSTIAQKYQVKAGEIANENNISNPAMIRSGMTLVIPGWKAPKSAAKAADASAGAPAVLMSEPDSNAAPAKTMTPADIPVIKIENSAK
jgi:LysM repeat protein